MKTNNVQLNKNHITSNDSFIIMALFYCLFFLVVDFNISVVAVVVLLTLLEVVTAFIVVGRYRFNKTIYLPYFLLILLILINLRPNGYISDQPFYLFSMLMFLFIIPLCKPSDTDRDRVISILLVTAFFVAIIVFVSIISPSFYNLTYLKIVSSSSKEYNQWVMGQGYAGVVGRDVGFSAMYIIVGLSFCFSRYICLKKKKYLLLLLFLFIALILVGRRSELLAFLMSALLVFYAYSSRKKKHILVFLICLFFIVTFTFIILIFFRVITYSGHNRIIQTLFSLIYGEDVTNGRSTLYAATWESIKEHPVFGVGWGGARSFIREILSNDTNVHCIYLQLLCEIGVVGTLFFIIIATIIFIKKYKVFIKYRATNKSVYITASLLLFIYITIFGIFNNPIFVDYFWFVVSIIFFMSNNLDYKCNVIEAKKHNTCQKKIK